MKTFKNFVAEDMPTTSVGGGHIASVGVGDQGEPPGKKKRKPLIRKMPPS